MAPQGRCSVFHFRGRPYRPERRASRPPSERHLSRLLSRSYRPVLAQIPSSLPKQRERFSRPLSIEQEMPAPDHLCLAAVLRAFTNIAEIIEKLIAVSIGPREKCSGGPSGVTPSHISSPYRHPSPIPAAPYLSRPPQSHAPAERPPPGGASRPHIG